jgi:hypothetical protein
MKNPHLGALWVLPLGFVIAVVWPGVLRAPVSLSRIGYPFNETAAMNTCDFKATDSPTRLWLNSSMSTATFSPPSTCRSALQAISSTRPRMSIFRSASTAHSRSTSPRLPLVTSTTTAIWTCLRRYLCERCGRSAVLCADSFRRRQRSLSQPGSDYKESNKWFLNHAYTRTFVPLRVPTRPPDPWEWQVGLHVLLPLSPSRGLQSDDYLNILDAYSTPKLRYKIPLSNSIGETKALLAPPFCSGLW